MFDIANRLHIDTNIADRFYGYWTQIAVPELKIMKFETEDAWKTENMLRGMNNRIQAKNS